MAHLVSVRAVTTYKPPQPSMPMTAYNSQILLDFGDVGYHRSRSPFRVRLDATALAELIVDAENAHRVYELLLIERPGDVWDYVRVVPEALPDSVARRVASFTKTEFPERSSGERAMTASIPFAAFDALFYWAGDDTEPADQAWLEQRDSSVMREFAKQLLAMTDLARSRIDGNDPLLNHLAALARSDEHPYTFMQRAVAVREGRANPPRPPAHDDGFYHQLEKLLRDPEIVSIAYRGNGDQRILRMLATEQRRRANRTGHAAGDALHVSALVNRRVENRAWDSKIWFFEEGLAHGDLRIETQSMGGASMRSLVEEHDCVPGRFILSIQDEGPIKGFERQAGEGWCLYRAERPNNRRLALDRIQDRRLGRLGPILSFREEGATLYEHDKTVIFMGEAMAPEDCPSLAAALAEWQRYGGGPTLIALCDLHSLLQAGVKRLLQPGIKQVRSDSERTTWLLQTLERERPWIDAMLLLKTPEWALKVMASAAEHQTRPWPPWIVATEASSRIHVDLILDGNLDDQFFEASRRAKARRHRAS